MPEHAALDRIELTGISFHGFHGVPAAERAAGHRYSVDLVLLLPLRRAGETDDVAETVDYSEAVRIVLEVGQGPGVQLVETLAEQICSRLLGSFDRLQGVEVAVSKLYPPVDLPFARSCVRLKRFRAET